MMQAGPLIHESLAVPASGQTLATHDHFDFAAKSGIPGKGGIARKKHSLCESVRLALTVDQA
ncbi:MAG: hypothetical protein VXW25_05590, partial [Pseudomonadota bacterium]|nr:hypothetical protein [Pseudomonadota bacterium]